MPSGYNSTYWANFGLGTYPGTVDPETPQMILSYVAEEDVPFGRPVCRGPTMEQLTCVDGIQGQSGIIDITNPEVHAELTQFLGIALCDPTAHGLADSMYRRGDAVSVMIGGTVYVTNSRGYVEAGSPVYVSVVDSSFGELDEFAAPIAGAVWLDNVRQNSIGRIRLVGVNQV